MWGSSQSYTGKDYLPREPPLGLQPKDPDARVHGSILPDDQEVGAAPASVSGEVDKHRVAPLQRGDPPPSERNECDCSRCLSVNPHLGEVGWVPLTRPRLGLPGARLQPPFLRRRPRGQPRPGQARQVFWEDPWEGTIP